MILRNVTSVILRNVTSVKNIALTDLLSIRDDKIFLTLVSEPKEALEPRCEHILTFDYEQAGHLVALVERYRRALKLLGGL